MRKVTRSRFLAGSEWMEGERFFFFLRDKQPDEEGYEVALLDWLRMFGDGTLPDSKCFNDIYSSVNCDLDGILNILDNFSSVFRPLSHLWGGLSVRANMDGLFPISATRWTDDLVLGNIVS
jgi:hypothetical protein